MRETSFSILNRPALRAGISLDQERLSYVEERRKKRRPPLVHSDCFDQSSEFEYTDRPLTRVGLKQKPLSAEEASTLIEEETQSNFGSTRYLSKSENFCLLDHPQSSLDSDSSTSKRQVSFNNNNNKVLKAQMSIDIAENISDLNSSMLNDPNTSRLITTTALVHSNTASSQEETSSEARFRPNRLPGVSDRVPPKLVKQNRVQRLSSSSLQVQTKETSLTRLFEKRFGRKNNRLEKSKRLSTSALYDQSPTEALYKSKSGSGRLSSIQLFEKFCSEDFSSLYGNSETPEEEETDFDFYDNPTTSKSEDSVPHFNFYENPLERASVTALYERFCYDNRHSSSTSHDTATSSSTGAIRKQPPNSIFTRDQDNDVFIFDTPEVNTPALSRGSETETSFNDDFISSFNDDFFIPSLNDDMLMSPNLETLIEDRMDEESEHTQVFEAEKDTGGGVSDYYEPCLGVHLQPKRRSIKKEIIPSMKDRPWDLSNLDLRPIDDDDDDDPESKTYLANIDETNSIENHSDESEKLITKSNSVSSRLSMHKLQPFCFKRSDTADSDEPEAVSEATITRATSTDVNSGGACDKMTESMIHLALEPMKVATQVEIKPDKSVFFRVRRDKSSSAVTVHRKTNCFPL